MTTTAIIHAKKVHTHSHASPLSTESPVQDYRGFHNLVMLLLFVNNLRLVVENYIKYGLLLSIPDIGLMRDDLFKGLCLCLAVPVFVIFSLWIEQAVAWFHVPGQASVLMEASNTATATVREARQLHSRAVHSPKKQSITPEQPVQQLRFSPWPARLHTINILALAIIPNWYAFCYMQHPLLISTPCFASMIYCIKLISYVLVNAELRQLSAQGIEVNAYDKDVAYPRNLTVSNLLYFCLAPTLCYQPSYPRSPRIRRSFLFRRVLELVTMLGMMYFITEQYSRPTLENSLKPFHQLKWFGMAERILKLSIPSIYIWLLMFYAFFHSYLNMWAEILQFGDREFYKPWWNASTIAQYWRLWNVPVYTFFKRHVYVPFKSSYPKYAQLGHLVAFFISALAHEILVAVPTHIFKGWAFGGMMFQLPLIWLSEILHRMEKNRFHRKGRGRKKSNEQDEDEEPYIGAVGNYIFWISFCIVGQPLCVILYFREWYLREHPDLVAKAVSG